MGIIFPFDIVSYQAYMVSYDKCGNIANNIARNARVSYSRK